MTPPQIPTRLINIRIADNNRNGMLDPNEDIIFTRELLDSSHRRIEDRENAHQYFQAQFQFSGIARLFCMHESPQYRLQALLSQAPRLRISPLLSNDISNEQARWIQQGCANP